MTQLGRIFFALAIAVFGTQYLFYGIETGGLPPLPPWTPGHSTPHGSVLAYAAGLVLLSAGLSMLANRKSRLAALFVGAFFLLSVLFLHLLHAREVWNDGVARTRALEPLALSGAAFVLAAILPADSSRWVNSATDRFALCGRLLFTIPMIPFGYQHFIYASFIATLIPAWIPGHLFFAYFTGAAFLAAAAAILAKIQAPLAANLLALMFFLWVVVLHAPRVAAHPHNGDEWTSLFIALAFSGGSLLIASSMAKSHRRIS